MANRRKHGLETDPSKIYFGKRDASFKSLLISILEKGRLKRKYINTILDDEGMLEYGKAFTSDTADPVNNYQVYEFIGDLDANHAIGKYMLYKFPQLNCGKGVDILSKLKAKYSSKGSFADIALRLDFWDYITVSNEARLTDRQSLLEDSLEAFFGVTETLLDKRFRPGVGFAIVQEIIYVLFDQYVKISLQYRDIADAKTILKELTESTANRAFFPRKLDVKSERNNNVVTTVITYYNQQNNNRAEIIGSGTASIAKKAEQIASSEALKTLKEKYGIFKPEPPEYEQFHNFSLALSRSDKSYNYG